MKFDSFRTSDWLKVGGGIGMLIFGFVSWIKVSIPGYGSESFGNAFDFFFTGTVPWILVVGTGVITVLLAGGVLKVAAPWPLITLAATALAAVLLLIRLIFNPLGGAGIFDDGFGRGIGMWLSVVAGLVALAGSVIGFTESGGDLKSLTDVDKLKAQLKTSSAGGDTPPPPSQSAPPPPPPSSPMPPPPMPG